MTAYPEVNDLILAADVAVLDYSSMRFDVALAGKPAVFLVPDLEDYTEQTRGFLFDFARSAPGLLVDTTEQVIAALADLPALAEAWAPRIAEFNAYFHRLDDGRAAERVVDEFFRPLLEGWRPPTYPSPRRAARTRAETWPSASALKRALNAARASA